MARRQGAARRLDDRLVAFYARFRTASEEDADARTMIESAPDGWWYTALLPSGERVAAWLTDADLADRAALLSPPGFTARLRESPHLGALFARFGYALHGRPRVLAPAEAGAALEAAPDERALRNRAGRSLPWPRERTAPRSHRP